MREGASGAWRRVVVGWVALAGGVALATLPIPEVGAVPGGLTQAQVLIDGGGGVDGIDGAYGVTVSPDGAHVYVAGFSDDAVAVFARNPDTEQLTFIEMEVDGVGGVDGLDGVGRLALSADGGHLYAVAEVDDSVAAFTRNPTTGELGFVEVEKDGIGGVEGLNSAFGVAVSPDGAHVYTAAFEDDAVTASPGIRPREHWR